MASLAPLGPEFQPFLQSKLWADKDEMPLTVLSALARLDIDAWQEAAELAALPKVGAEKRLADRLRKLPGAPSAEREVDTLCGRSVSLLPQGQKLAIVPGVARAKTKARVLGLASVYIFIGAWVAVVYMLTLTNPAVLQRGAAAVASSSQVMSAPAAARRPGR